MLATLKKYRREDRALFKIPLPDTSDLYHLEGVKGNVVKSWINLSLTNGRPLERWPETVKSRSRLQLSDQPLHILALHLP